MQVWIYVTNMEKLHWITLQKRTSICYSLVVRKHMIYQTYTRIDKRSASIKEEEEHVSRMLSSVTIPQKNSTES